MASRLYKSAVTLISDVERKRLVSLGAWLQSHREPLCDGRKLAANLAQEAHLTGDKAFGDLAELTSFLKLCATGHARARSNAAKMSNYCAACASFELKGLAIPRAHLPGTLLRYSSSRKLVATVLERQLGKTARTAFDGGTMTPEDAFSRLALSWISSRLTAAEKLSGGRVVFATFEHAAGAPRSSALGMIEALALPVLVRISGDEDILFELTYETDSVADYRFPTVADAGSWHRFEPAQELAPDPAAPATCCGWTRPAGTHPPQPEIVHANESLRTLSASPRFLGRFTK